MGQKGGREVARIPISLTERNSIDIRKGLGEKWVFAHFNERIRVRNPPLHERDRVHIAEGRLKRQKHIKTGGDERKISLNKRKEVIGRGPAL